MRFCFNPLIVFSLPLISPQEFIKEMEGYITEGTPTIDPLKLRKIWEEIHLFQRGF